MVVLDPSATLAEGGDTAEAVQAEGLEASVIALLSAETCCLLLGLLLVVIYAAGPNAQLLWLLSAEDSSLHSA